MPNSTHQQQQAFPPQVSSTCPWAESMDEGCTDTMGQLYVRSFREVNFRDKMFKELNIKIQADTIMT